MEKRYFFSSPIDHDSLDTWPGLAESLAKMARQVCRGEISVVVGSKPVFGYDIDAYESLEALAQDPLDPREVRVDLWSDVRRHAVICLSLGPGLVRSEHRSLLQKVEKGPLRGEARLREVEGPYDLDSGVVYGYALSAEDAGDRSAIEVLLMPYDPPTYLGESWLIQGSDEQVDPEAYGTSFEVSPDLTVFMAEHREAEEEVWRRSAQGEGLVVAYDEEAETPALLQGFFAHKDLALFIGPARGHGQRVTLNRGPLGEPLVVVYDPAYAPEIEAPILFMI